MAATGGIACPFPLPTESESVAVESGAMDTLTHGLLGAATAQLGFRQGTGGAGERAGRRASQRIAQGAARPGSRQAVRVRGVDQ